MEAPCSFSILEVEPISLFVASLTAFTFSRTIFWLYSAPATVTAILRAEIVTFSARSTARISSLLLRRTISIAIIPCILTACICCISITFWRSGNCTSSSMNFIRSSSTFSIFAFSIAAVIASSICMPSSICWASFLVRSRRASCSTSRVVLSCLRTSFPLPREATVVAITSSAFSNFWK